MYKIVARRVSDLIPTKGQRSFYGKAKLVEKLITSCFCKAMTRLYVTGMKKANSSGCGTGTAQQQCVMWIASLITVACRAVERNGGMRRAWKSIKQKGKRKWSKLFCRR